MKQLTVLLVAMALVMTAQDGWTDLQIGQVPPPVVLQEKQGGLLDGTPWSSASLTGKVTTFFYVDPDESDLNDAAMEALRAEKFPREHYRSMGVINMAATWLPNFAINRSLKKKQAQYPDSIYVRDNEKVLVQAWGLSDDNNCALAFDKQGRLIFRKDGQLDDNEIAAMIQAIRAHLED